jgi:hypothetical protein
MKLKNLFILLFAAILMGFTACNETATATANNETEAEANANEADGEGEGEEEGDGDETETRLSPLKEANAVIGETKMQIKYGSPAVKGRQVWGELVPYGKVWRTGANEATTFEVDKPVTINGEALAAGKYSLFTIPGESEWIVIFNSVWDQWGAYDYVGEKDALRVTVAAAEAELQERLEFKINEGGEVVIAWEKVQVPFTVAEAAQE